MGPKTRGSIGGAKAKVIKHVVPSDSEDNPTSDNESNESNYQDESDVNDAADESTASDDDEGLVDEEDEDFNNSTTKKGKAKGKTKEKTAKLTGKKRTKAQQPKAKAAPQSKYTKRKHPFDSSLMFSRSKYLRCRDLWMATPEYKTSAKVKEISLLGNSKTAHFLKQIPVESLNSWMSKRRISNQVFEDIIIRDADNDDIEQLRLKPFEGKAFTRPPSDDLDHGHSMGDKDILMSALDSLDVVMNCSGPIQTISFERFFKQAPQMLNDDDESVEFSMIVGLSRIGWPSATDDYEREARSDSYETLKKHFNIPATAPLLTCSGSYGSCSDYPRLQSVSETHDNLLQIWKVKATQKSSGANPVSVDIAVGYFVALDRCGSILKISWNPNIAFEDKSLIGLAAVLTSSGKVFVLHLPKSIVNTIPVDSTSQFGHLTVVDYHSFLLCEIFYPQSLMITSVAWVNAGFADLCCGMSDGSVTVWTVNNCLLEKEKTPIMLFRMADGLADFRSHASNSVVSIDCCPFLPNILLTGYADGTLKMWDMKEPTVPVFTKRTANFAISNVQWDLAGCGCYFTDIENTIIYWESLWNCDRLQCGRVRGQLYSHSLSQGSAFGLVHGICNDQSFVVSCATDGSVRCGFTSLLGLIRPHWEGLMELFRIQSVENSLDSSNSSDNTTAPKIVSVSRKERLTAEKTIENKINDRFETYLRGLDMCSFAKEGQEEVHILSYGGETGIIRLHGIKVVSRLVAKDLHD